MPVIPDTTWYQQLTNPYADQNYMTSARPADGPPDLLYDFGSVANAADLTSIFSYWGTKGTAYGTQGDTSISRASKTSSAKLSIQQGSDGLSETVTNGEFGGGFDAGIGWDLSENDELWTGIWIWVPVGFDWRTNTTALKFLRHTFAGKTTKLDVQILHDGNVAQQGWKILHESFPQTAVNDARNSNVILNEGEWSFITFYTKFHSDGAQAIVRLSKGQEFIYERNGTNIKWRDENGIIQNDTVLSLPTLQDAATVLNGTMNFTYWNGGNTTHTGTHPTQDQELHIDSFGYQLLAPTLLDDQSNPVLDGSAF